jgi:hypothetical protein
MIKNYLKLAIVILFCGFVSYGQQINRIQSRCPSPYQLTKSQVSANANGDILYIPCTGQSSIFSGLVNFSGATVTFPAFGLPDGTAGAPSLFFTNSPTTGLYRSAADTFAISTAGTLNTSFSAATNLFTSPIQTFTSSTSDNHNTALFTINGSAGTSEFAATFTPSTTASNGSLFFGDNTGTTQSYLQLSNAGRSVTLGTGSATATTSLTVSGASNAFSFNNSLSTGLFSLSAIQQYLLQRTITAAGTTGAQTIDKPNGTVNFAAAATSLVVTNSTVTNTAGSQSTIIATAQTNDATCAVKNVVAGAGSFTINMTAACTAETRVAFWVFN